jgi:hypothetical protein
MRASGSASTKVKESDDPVEHLVFWLTNSKVETVDSDRDLVDDWSGSGNSTGLATMSSSVILSEFIEDSPFVELMA